jgi:hypothetical protein
MHRFLDICHHWIETRESESRCDRPDELFKPQVWLPQANSKRRASSPRAGLVGRRGGFTSVSSACSQLPHKLQISFIASFTVSSSLPLFFLSNSPSPPHLFLTLFLTSHQNIMKFSLISTLVVALATESVVASGWFSKAGTSSCRQTLAAPCNLQRRTCISTCVYGF